MKPLKLLKALEPVRKSSGAVTTWWPQDLGTPSVLGSSNGLQYAYFADRHRLVVDDGKTVKVYDTEAKLISGFTSDDREPLAFQTQDGRQRLSSLKVLSIIL